MGETPIIGLLLTADEVVCLLDRIRNDETGTPEMQLSVYPLLLKLGSLYVEFFGDGTANKPIGELAINLTEQETWLLRSKVTSGDKLASDNLFGIKLLCKLYRLLLAYNIGIEIIAGGIDDEFSDDRRRALQRWLGGRS